MMFTDLGGHWRSLVAEAAEPAAAVPWQCDGPGRRAPDAPSLAADGFALVHPGDRDWLRAAVSAAARGERSYDFEFRLICPDGHVEVVRDRGRLLRDEAGRPLRLSGVAQLATAQRRAEAAFAATFEQAAVGIAHVAPDGTFLKVNDALCRIWGRPRESLLCLGFQDITHADDLMADLAQVQALLEGRIATYTMEKRYLLPDGGLLWANLTVSLVRDLAGEPDYFISVVEDISRRKSLEGLDHDLLRGLLDGGPNCIKVLDAAGRLLHVNAQALRALDLDDFEPIRNQPFDALWPEEARADVRGAVTLARAGGHARFHAYGPTATGRPKWWAVAVWPLPGGDGRLVAVSHDVTEAHLATLAFTESEAKFRTLVEAMPQSAFIARPDGYNEFQNARWFEYTGRTAAQSAGFGWEAAIHPEDLARTRADWVRSRECGEAYGIEHRLLGADGTYRWFLTRAVPLRESDGTQIQRWFGTCTDISELVAARDAAARSAAELEALVAERTLALTDAARELSGEMRRREEAQAALLQSRKLEALGQLTGGVAHDFNNVLAAITGSYALIRRRTDSPELLEIVRHGEAAAERATCLIRQLLAFARKEELTPAELDPVALLRDSADLLGHAVGAVVRVELDLPADAWPVLADRHQLEVALLNLAVNGRDAMPLGGSLTLGVRNVADGPCGRSYVAFTVRDEGEGMSPEVLARATDPFFTTKAVGQGTGLGLSMVHGFATQSGGLLRIESEPDAGTLVQLLLPRAALTGATDPALPIAAAMDPALHGGAAVLLVEDDAQLRPITAGILRSLNYTVVEAANAEAAMALVHMLDTLDLVVTDVRMPGMNGPAMAARLRQERPDLPVLFTTGHAPEAGLPEGAVLQKPFSAAELAGAVLDRLGRRWRTQAAPAVADRLLARIRAPALRQLLQAWHDARQDSLLPRDGSVHLAAFGLDPYGYLVDVDATCTPTALRYRMLGPALLERLGRPFGTLSTMGMAADDTGMLGSLDAAYRRCARLMAPVYQSARYDFGDGEPLSFERLLLPISSDGSSITQLLGVALFDGPIPLNGIMP